VPPFAYSVSSSICGASGISWRSNHKLRGFAHHLFGDLELLGLKVLGRRRGICLGIFIKPQGIASEPRGSDRLQGALIIHPPPDPCVTPSPARSDNNTPKRHSGNTASKGLPPGARTLLRKHFKRRKGIEWARQALKRFLVSRSHARCQATQPKGPTAGSTSLGSGINI